MIKPIKKIEPLREDLNGLIPNKFYTTTTFKRWLVENNLHDLWGQCLDYAENENTGIMISDYKSVEAGDAMTLLLNYFYEKDLSFFIRFIIHLLKLYIDVTKKECDITNLRKDLTIIGIDDESLIEFDKLTEKEEIFKESEEPLTDEQRIRNLEQIYVSTLDDGPNYKKSTDAYYEWYTQTLLYLSDYYTINNPDFAKFKNTDNSLNGFGLKTNYYSLKATYNLLMKNVSKQINFNQPQKEKTPMVFISHSSKDKPFVEALVDLLESIGLSNENLFCSSVDGYGISLGEDIFETLRNLFIEHDLFVIFIHSPRYYESTVSLNEMGAAWVLRTNFCSILTKDMEFPGLKGVVNDSNIAIKVSAADATARFNELKDCLIQVFGLVPISETQWERKRNIFLKYVNNIEI